MSTQTITTGPPSEIISYDPATGEVIGRVARRTAAEVREAVARARTAQKSWSGVSFHDRAAIVLKAREIVLEQTDEIAKIITRETGKPVAEAISMEIVPGLDLMRFFARNTANLLEAQPIDIGQYGLMGRSSQIVYKPLGVIGIISPWNFPWATPLDEVVMALMAGNAVVLKPSELTPFTALKIGEVFKQAGLPDHVLEIVTGDGSTGAALVDAAVDKLMFTGSVETGKRVAETAAKHLTPVVLELGGKDPMIVFEDANLKNAARAAVWGAFANAGQACSSIERCYVHESIAKEFIDLVVTETAALKQGAPDSENVDLGAMSNEGQLKLVEDHIADAKVRGAQILTGGARLSGNDGWFHEPTVIVNVDHSMKVMRDETFGPVLPIMTFNSEDEAIRMANDSVYGLTASVWTGSMRRGEGVAQRIDAGTVMVNEVVYTHGIAQTPWGGVKQSGYGRTHGRMGLLELVTAQHIHINRVPWVADVWWFRYSKDAVDLFRGLARRFTNGSIVQTSVLLPQLIKRWRETRKRA